MIVQKLSDGTYRVKDADKLIETKNIPGGGQYQIWETPSTPDGTKYYRYRVKMPGEMGRTGRGHRDLNNLRNSYIPSVIKTMQETKKRWG